MKYFLLITAAVLLLASSLAFSGAVQPAPVRIFFNNGVDDADGGFALGDMLTARDDDTRDESPGDDDSNDDVLIGCGIKGFDNGDGTAFQYIFCQATGLQNDPGTFEPLDPETVVGALCFSDNRGLVDILKAVDSYSFLRFTFRQPTEDEKNDGVFGDTIRCDRVDVSTQSFYLPKTKANKAPD